MILNASIAHRPVKALTTSSGAFRSAKCSADIPVRTPLVRRALIQATLDPGVETIAAGLLTDAGDASVDFVRYGVSDLAAVVIDRVATVGQGATAAPSLLGVPVLQLSAAQILAEPMATNAMQVWACSTRPVSAADQVRVLERLSEAGCATLAEAGEAVRSTDGIEVVLALCCRCLVEAWLGDRPLGPETRVSRCPTR